MRRIAQRRRRLFGSLIVAGLAVGLTAALVWPSAFRADIEIVVARADDDGRIENPLEREAQFVNAEVVRSTVRAVLPNAPDRIDVEIDDDRWILRLEASSGSPDDSLRLVRTWADAFVEQRQLALTATLTRRSEVLEQDLDRLATQIGAARQLGDDAEVERLQAQRDAAAAERVQTLNELAVVQRGAFAAIVAEGELPTERSGVRLVPALALGAALGALAAAAIAGWLDRASRQVDEAERWLGADERVGDALSGSVPPGADRPPLEAPQGQPAESTATPIVPQPPPAESTATPVVPQPPPTESTATPVVPQPPPTESTAAGPAVRNREPAVTLPRIPPGRRHQPLADDGRIRFPAQRLDPPLRIVTLPERDGD